MANVTVSNLRVSSTTDSLTAIWKLTRAMLATGWKYKSSGDGLVKETTGVSNTDRWGIGGGINLIQVGSQTGTSPTIGTPSSGVSTITGVSGFVTNSVGRFLTLSGCSNSANNGTFRITAQSGTTVSIFNPNAVSEAGISSMSWTEKHGGASATIVTAGTSGATPGRAKVTGLTGMQIPSTWNRGSVGNRLTIIGGAIGANNGTFLITRVISSSEVEIENASATSSGETNNGSIIWAETDMMEQVFPTATVGTTTGCWINLQGPSTLKIPISTGTPTGNFYRGENVVQSSTGAEGEVVGVVVDTSGGLGYLVIHPRINGTGGGVRGWATGNNITGSLSGAVIAQNGTAIEFVREVVFWRGNSVSQGHIYAQCVDQSGESASRYSVLATGGSVTSILAPAGPTGTFPATGSWVVLGSGGSNSATSGQAYWSSTTSSPSLGVLHILCANCIGTLGVSEDGSWACVFSNTSGPGYSNVVGWQIVENSEDGDVDPYVTWAFRSNATYTNSRTLPTLASPNTDGMYIGNWSLYPYFQGWRRRGMSTNDVWQEFQMSVLGWPSSSLTTVLNGNAEKVACVPNPQLIPVKETLWIISIQLNQKMRKGSLRWWYAIQGGVAHAFYQNGLFIGFGSSGTTGPLIGGPWDGSTPGSNS